MIASWFVLKLLCGRSFLCLLMSYYTRYSSIINGDPHQFITRLQSNLKLHRKNGSILLSIKLMILSNVHLKHTAIIWWKTTLDTAELNNIQKVNDNCFLEPSDIYNNGHFVQMPIYTHLSFKGLIALILKLTKLLIKVKIANFQIIKSHTPSN